MVALWAFVAHARAADVSLALTLRWRGEAVALPSSTLTNDAGQRLRLTRFAALISGVALVRPDGSSVRLEGQYGLIDATNGRRTVTLRGVPEGEFVGLEFNVGVPPGVNHGDSGSWPAGHPLNPLVNGLHWSWQGGYVFAAIEGHWSEGGVARAENERGFSYHLATDARLIPVRFLANYRIAGDTTIGLALDLARVIAPQRLVAEDGSESTHSVEGDVLAVQLAVAMARAWFWLGAGSAQMPVAESAPAFPTAAEQKITALPFAFTVPAGFPQPALPADNPLTVEGIALGELLFSDPRLSGNGAQSCASCHAVERAFSDVAALSRGADGIAGARNAMPLVNLAWSPHFAWDGSQPRIRDQARAAWTNPIEMHAAPSKIVAVLAADSALATRFRRAFATREITAERITLALEQYLLVQVAADSKFDRALRGTAELSEEEKHGFELFATEYDPGRGRRGADCFHCHGGALFTDFAMKNNGLDRIPLDRGRGAVTGSGDDHGKFKTPSLRNVALTAPYMHDGRFATLEEVVAHYDHGVQRAPSLDPNLGKHPDGGLELSPDDQRALVAFLRALTDARFGYSSPSQ